MTLLETRTGSVVDTVRRLLCLCHEDPSIVMLLSIVVVLVEDTFSSCKVHQVVVMSHQPTRGFQGEHGTRNKTVKIKARKHGNFSVG